MIMIGLIPCGGTASRLHSIPKFLLPTPNGCLLTRWIELIRPKCEYVIIGCNKYTYTYIMTYFETTKYNLEGLIVTDIGTTTTMNETILRMTFNIFYETALMVMPDTYVEELGDLAVDEKTIIGVHLWGLRESQRGKIGQCETKGEYAVDIVDKSTECEYKNGWGAVIWHRSFEKYIDIDEPHVGYSMSKYLKKGDIIFKKNRGQYFDCGTFEGYGEFSSMFSGSDVIYFMEPIVVVNYKSEEGLAEFVGDLARKWDYNIFICGEKKIDINGVYNIRSDIIGKYKSKKYIQLEFPPNGMS